MGAARLFAFLRVWGRGMKDEILREHLEYKIPQIRLALVQEGPAEESAPIRRPEDLDRFVEPLKHYSEEYFVAFHLNVKHHVIGYHEVSHGTLSESVVHPREVFKAALLSNAYAVILAHNHPGGSLTASPEDLQTTSTLVRAGKLLGVQVVDHVIVSSAGIASIRASHDELFK